MHLAYALDKRAEFRKGNEIGIIDPCFREGLAGLVELEKLGD